jgi:hypothetical protein
VFAVRAGSCPEGGQATGSPGPPLLDCGVAGLPGRADPRWVARKWGLSTSGPVRKQDNDRHLGP